MKDEQKHHEMESMEDKQKTMQLTSTIQSGFDNVNKRIDKTNSHAKVKNEEFKNYFKDINAKIDNFETKENVAKIEALCSKMVAFSDMTAFQEKIYPKVEAASTLVLSYKEDNE